MKYLTLLASKRFEELSGIERQAVLAHISQSDYKESHQAITGFQDADRSEVFLEPGLPLQKRKHSPILRFATHRIPIYQVAAGISANGSGYIWIEYFE